MKILLIEDEQKIVSFLIKGLEEQGFVVEVAMDGEEGLKLALQKDYDLLIVDVMLPKMDGWTVVSTLRNRGRSTLALFLTARDTTEDRVQGLNIGADAYLTKPFVFSELLAVVRSLLRRPQQFIGNLLNIADLQIDISRHQVIRSGKKIDLSAKEFSLLYLLARKKGEVLSRSLIAEKVWGIHYDSETNIIDVHIRRLRAKVDDPFEKKLIQTVRGMGYTLSDSEVSE